MKCEMGSDVCDFFSISVRLNMLDWGKGDVVLNFFGMTSEGMPSRQNPTSR